MRKKFALVLVIALILQCMPITAFAGGDGDIADSAQVTEWKEAGYPVVQGILDAKGCYENGSGGWVDSTYPQGSLSTDQMGEYISIYVRGYNISKDTVKPIFYDVNGTVISGEIAAQEISDKGTFFRIKKLNSAEWKIENASSVNDKWYKVELEAVGDKEIKDPNNVAAAGNYSTEVDIIRRDVYAEMYDNIRDTYTVWMSSDIDVDATDKPVMKWGYADIVDGEMVLKEAFRLTASSVEKAVNKLTGQMETRVIFPVAPDFDKEAVFGFWSPEYELEFKNKATGQKETYSAIEDRQFSQVVGMVERFGTTFEQDKVNGKTDTAFYYPYWIGGVYQKKANGNSDNYITEADAKVLGNERLSYSEYDSKKGDQYTFNRQYQWKFWAKADLPEMPVGKPAVTVVVKDGNTTLSWNPIKNAAGYIVRAPFGRTDYNIAKITGTSYTFTKSQLENLQRMGLESGLANGKGVPVCIIPYAEKGAVTLHGEMSDTVWLDPNAKDTVVEHTPKKTVTRATLSANGKIVTKCSTCGKVLASQTIYYPKSISLSTTHYTYTGSVRQPAVKVVGSNGKTISASNYTVTYASGRKNIGRYAVKVTFKGNYSGSKTIYFTIGPKNPTSVTTSLYGYDDVQLKWNKVSGASGYVIYYKKSTSSSYVKLGVASAAATSYKKANLADGAQYIFKVVAYKKVGSYNCYNAGKTSSIYTLRRTYTPVVSRYGSKVKVKWSNIAGESGYQISQSTTKTGTKIVSTYATTSGNYRYVSATKGKYYYYKVRAYRQVGTKKIYGPWSTAVRYRR